MAVTLSFSVAANVCLLLFILYLARSGQFHITNVLHSANDILSRILKPNARHTKSSLDVSLANQDSPNLDSGIHLRRISAFEVLPTQENAIVFLGDSLIQACEWSELVGRPQIQNRGIAGDTVTMLIKRLPQVMRSQPSQVIMMVGVNDLRHQGCNVDRVMHHYRNLLEKIIRISPRTNVLVHSVLPVNIQLFEERFHKAGLPINQRVVQFNQQLKLVAKVCHVQYIDLLPIMTTQSGKLRPEYTVDGIHLSGAAYKIWSQHLQSFLAHKRVAN